MKQTSILITILSILLLTACVTKQTDEKIVTVTIEPQRDSGRSCSFRSG